MEDEKRDREDDGGQASAAKRAKPAGEQAQPLDEEVEEFFAILKRIQVAVKYFEKRNSGKYTDGGAVTSTTEKSIWTPSFKREDFEGAKGEVEVEVEVELNLDKLADDRDGRKAGLDLNSDPTSDVSDSG